MAEFKVTKGERPRVGKSPKKSVSGQRVGSGGGPVRADGRANLRGGANREREPQPYWKSPAAIVGLRNQRPA